MTLLRLATRGSPLALWQARLVAMRLRLRHPGLRVRIVTIVSSGDRDRSTALYASGDVGMFVKEIQEAVLSGHCDVGVHSCKDLPTTLPAGLVLAAVPARADPRDCLVGTTALSRLPASALIGSSSLRRQFQLMKLRPDLRFIPIRGNVETRLGKIATGEIAATILAAAGLNRLGLMRRASAIPFSIEEMVPAPAQGAIACDCRSNDARTQWLLGGISEIQALQAISLERAVLASFAGGCSLPLGCVARRRRGNWELHARLSSSGADTQAHYLGPAQAAVSSIVSQLQR